MSKIVTVCTGNICRSPLAELLLRARLADLDVELGSAGTAGFADAPMPEEAQELARRLGVDADAAAAHRSRYLTERELVGADLVLAMGREHRRRVVELDPAKLRVSFTLREFARLSTEVTTEELRAVAGTAGSDPSARLRAIVVFLGSRRGTVPPPETPEDDDVIDPYRRSRATYELSGQQLAPAVDEVVRVVRAALTA